MKKKLGFLVAVFIGLTAAAIAGTYDATSSGSAVPDSGSALMSDSPLMDESPMVSDSPAADTQDLVYIEIEASAVQNGEDRPIPDSSNADYTLELSKDGMVFFSQKIQFVRDGKLVWQPSPALKGFSTSDMIAVRITGTLNGVSVAGNQTFNPAPYGQGLSVEGTMQLKAVETAPAPSPKE